ncbi:protein of unknown function DUF4216 - like 2 [Theobroma cacao]|nr:protein of unknown function DUF4216 - like 2 [Theobroma cacao]
MRPEVAFNHGSENESSFVEEDPNPNASFFYSLLSNVEEPLWVGCTKHTTLSAVSQLLNVKAEYNLSESCFDQLLEIIKNMLPSDENLLIDFYRMKKKVAKLGLGYIKIDACKNNCMLFYERFATFEHCQNILNTVMDVKGRTKDNIKARQDLKVYCKRLELELMENNGKLYKPKAPYTLNKEEIRNVCAWVKQLRLPDGFASNISRCVNEIDYKIYGMKSHDCHVFMQRLLPIVFRDILPQRIWDSIIDISQFFRDLWATEIPIDHMETLQGKICETICKLERIFPPGFFNLMEHLPIHLPYEAKVGGPIQYRWMYPFERFLQQLKKKVKNRASVERSICEAYVIEEVSSFCSWYFEPVVRTKVNRVPHNDDGGEVDSMGRLSIFTHPRDVAIYKGDVVKISEEELEKVRDARFVKWFKNYVAKHNEEIDQHLIEISYGPGRMIRCYSGYFVNGFKFHTLDYGKNRKTMNSGVCIKGSFYNDHERDFYGILVDIIELEYFGIGNRVVLFKCHWFDTEKRIKVDRLHGLVDVNYNSILASNEPFVLVAQAHQVYYSSYPSRIRYRRDWWAVFKTKARSRFQIPISGDRENESDLNEGVYQENVSNSISSTQSEEVDLTELATGDYEEVNPSIEDEEDDIDKDEDEEDDMEREDNEDDDEDEDEDEDEYEDEDEDHVEHDECETYNDDSDNNAEHEFD